MATSQHPLERLGDRLAEYIEQASDRLAGNVASGDHAPFAAKATREQQMQFWHSRLYNPDGTPNQQGRQSIIEQRGVQIYADITRAVDKWRSGQFDQPAEDGSGAPANEQAAQEPALGKGY